MTSSQHNETYCQRFRVPAQLLRKIDGTRPVLFQRQLHSSSVATYRNLNPEITSMRLRNAKVHVKVTLAVLTFSPALMAADSDPNRQLTLDGVPMNNRTLPVYEQDDHLHTTPDRAFQIFKSLDIDSDRRVQWSEMRNSHYSVKREVFERLDTDGSDSLDREEFVAIGGSHESNYAEPGHSEP